MAQGKRTPEETKAKIVEMYLLNPNLSTHDIEEELEWTEHECSHDTVWRILEELRRLASTEKGKKILSTMDDIIDWIASITSLSVKTIQYKLNEWTLSVSDLKALNDIAKNNFDRKQILTWKPTENNSLIITFKE